GADGVQAQATARGLRRGRRPRAVVEAAGRGVADPPRAVDAVADDVGLAVADADRRPVARGRPQPPRRRGEAGAGGQADPPGAVVVEADNIRFAVAVE